MTVSNPTNKVIHQGNGSNTSFAFSFPVFAKTDLRVVVTDADGIESDLVLDAAGGFTVTLIGDGPYTGTVTYPFDVNGTTIDTGETLTIVRDLEYTQGSDLTNAGSFRAQTHENALDKLTMLCQQLNEAIQRALTLPISIASGVSASLPLPSAGQVIGWNANENGLENIDPLNGATMFTALDTQNAIADAGTLTAGITEITLSQSPGHKNAVDLYFNGVHQDVSTYSVSGNALTIGAAFTTDQTYEVRYRLLGSVLGTLVPAAQSVDTAQLAPGAVEFDKLDSACRLVRHTCDAQTPASLKNTDLIFSHSLPGGVSPIMVSLLFTCVDDDSETGHETGDKILITGPISMYSGVSSYGVQISAISTSSFRVNLAADGIPVLNESTRVVSTMTDAKWSITPTVIG